MKWRPRGDSQDPDSNPEEAVAERLAMPSDRRLGTGTAMLLSSLCLGETDCFIVSDDAIGLKWECLGRELWVEWFETSEDADGGRNTMASFHEKLCKLM